MAALKQVTRPITQKMSHTNGQHLSKDVATAAPTTSPGSELSSSSTLTMSSKEDPFSDALEYQSPLLPNTIYKESILEEGLSVTLPTVDQARVDKIGGHQANTATIWSRRHQSLNISWQTIDDGEIYTEHGDLNDPEDKSKMTLLGSPFQHVLRDINGTSNQNIAVQRQSDGREPSQRPSNSDRERATHFALLQKTAGTQHQIQAAFTELSMDSSSQAQPQQGGKPTGTILQSLKHRYSDIFKRPPLAKNKDVVIYEVLPAHRAKVKEVLQVFTSITLPTPYFLIATNAACTMEKLSAGQLYESGIINPHTGLPRFEPRFAGALFTVLTYDRSGSNSEVTLTKSAGRELKPFVLGPVPTRMFDGASVLVPETYEPWTLLKMMAFHNPPLVKRMTRPAVDGEVFQKTDFLHCDSLPRPLPQALRHIWVWEAQVSAARYSAKPSMRMLGPKERTHVYNGWLALLDVQLRNDPRIDFDKLRGKNKFVDLQFLHDERDTISRTVQKKFESDMRLRLDGSRQL
jgi:hypothetical protein